MRLPCGLGRLVGRVQGGVVCNRRVGRVWFGCDAPHCAGFSLAQRSVGALDPEISQQSVIGRISDYDLDHRLFAVGGVSPSRQLNRCVEKSLLPWIHKQPVMT